jgi:hypothetical protein
MMLSAMVRFLFLGFWLLMLQETASGQAVLRKDLKKDFGAVGDGKTNDQAAFQRAANFFNQRAKTPAGTGRAELHIPKGVYMVGRQDSTGKASDVLQLYECRNMKVLGDDSATTEIRYVEGFRYGSFEPATGRPYEAPTAYFVDHDYAATGQTCIALYRCENVEVSGLNLNGNSAHLTLGGHWGDTGIQLPFDGIYVSDSRRITMRRLALHHFGRDGIQVLNHLAKNVDDPTLEDIVLENSTCDYNGRQGLSLTGVNGFQAVNCSFSHTGRVVVASAGRALYSNPGAGVDLEPQDGFVANVRLENCRFVDNAGQGIVSDRPGGDHPVSVKNVVVAGGLLWGLSNYSAWITQPGFLFQNTRIYGAFNHGSRAATAAEATRFEGCIFEDRPYLGRAAYGPALLYSDSSARRMSFTRCQFIGTQAALLHAIPATNDTASLFHFRSCTFLLDYSQPRQESAGKLLGAVFSGSNAFRAGPHRTSPSRADFTLGSSSTPGTTVLRAPGRLQLQAAGSYYRVQGGLAIGQPGGSGRTSLEIGADNAVAIAGSPGEKPELYIGPNARLVVKKGGALELLPNTKVTIAGQLVVEAGAYLFRDARTEVTTTGRGQLQVSTQAIEAKHPMVHSE